MSIDHSADASGQYYRECFLQQISAYKCLHSGGNNPLLCCFACRRKTAIRGFKMQTPVLQRSSALHLTVKCGLSTSVQLNGSTSFQWRRCGFISCQHFEHRSTFWSRTLDTSKLTALSSRRRGERALCPDGKSPLVKATIGRVAVEENVQNELQQDLNLGFRVGRVDGEENVHNELQQGKSSSDNQDDFVAVLEILKIEGDKFRYHKVPKLKALKVKLEPALVLSILKHKEVKPSTAWKFFVWAKKQMGYKHTGEAYNIIIAKLLEIGKFTSIYFLLEDMYKDGVNLIPETCVRMAKTFGRAGMVERAIHSLRHMSRLGSPATTHHLNSLVTELLKSQHQYKAYIAYREMAKVGCEPDGLTFKLLLRELARVEKVELACRIFDDMQARGCEPDAETASIVVGILCQSGRMDDAIVVFEKVKEKRMKLNAKVYNNLLAGLGETGKVEKALEILEEMHLHEYLPENYSIATIVDLLANSGREEQAQKYRSLIQERRCI